MYEQRDGSACSWQPCSPFPGPALRRFGGLTFRSVRLRRLANPRPVVVRLAPGRESLAIARAVAGDHFLELLPVDLTELPVLGLFVVAKIRIREREVHGA